MQDDKKASVHDGEDAAAAANLSATTTTDSTQPVSVNPNKCETTQDQQHAIQPRVSVGLATVRQMLRQSSLWIAMILIELAY